MTRRRATAIQYALLLATLTLGACTSTGPATLKIDRSIRAQAQDSRVEFIVLHYTVSGKAVALKTLSGHNVSSHYLITDDAIPVVYQLVDENRRAWHAGISEWRGRSYLNASSIGIELVNRGGDGRHWDSYPERQIAALMALLRDIAGRHQVEPHNIVGHSDVAPGRKHDPGPLFPWKRLAEAGLGRWFDEERAQDYARQFTLEGAPDVTWMQSRLKQAGYALAVTGELDHATRSVVTAFQMHYRPARYDGEPDIETLAILKALDVPD